MTLLNRPSDGLSTVLLTAVRASRTVGSHDEEDFKSLLAPGALRETAADKIQQTLTRWTQLGLFRLDDGEISLSDEFAKVEYRHGRQFDYRDLRKATLTLALRAVGEDGGDKADDAVAAAWWLLSVDPFQHAIRNWPDAQGVLNETGVDEYLIQNDTRWSGLVDWMHFWGLLVQSYGNLPIIPNPAEAISWHLDELLPRQETTSVFELLKRLTDVLPIVPPLKDGAVTSPISAKLPLESRPLEERSPRLSVSLSLALHTLEERGLVQLHSHDIADRRWYLSDREQAAVTHVSRADG